jgi:hypothetical protein
MPNNTHTLTAFLTQSDPLVISSCKDFISSWTKFCLSGPDFAPPFRPLGRAALRRRDSRLLYDLRLMTPIRLLMLSFATLTSPRADRGYVCLKSLLLCRVRFWCQLDQGM